MKYHVSVLIFFSLTTQCTQDTPKTSPIPEFDIVIQPQWKDLEPDSEKVQKFGGKWILAGNITFRKKSKQTIHLDQLHLHWNGAPINRLVASLYKQDLDKPFCPIEKHVMCDGCWNKKKQLLKFSFNTKQTLGSKNIFCLVLTVPEDLEPTLKAGAFELVPHALPDPLKECLCKQKLSFNFKKVGPSTS